MSCETTTEFVNCPWSARALKQARHHVVALERSGHHLAGCTVRIEAQPRHCAAGQEYQVRIDAAIQAGSAGRRSARSAHADLDTALGIGFALLRNNLQGPSIAAASRRGPGPVPGHVVRLLPDQDLGVLLADTGDEIRFGRDDVEDQGFDRLHVGDRTWWMPDTMAAAGSGTRLACMVRHAGQQV